MNERELMQKAIARSMPDREAVRNRCMEKSKNAVGERGRRSYQIKLLVPAAVCAAIVLTVICALLYRNPSFKGIGVCESLTGVTENQAVVSGGQTVGSESQTVASDSKTSASTVRPTKPSVPKNSSSAVSSVNINELANLPTVGKSNIALKGNDFIKMSKQNLCYFYGINVFPSAVPKDMTEITNAASYGIYRRDNGTGDIYYSANGFCYANSSETRSLSVAVDKSKRPFTDIVTYENGENRISTINGQELSIGRYSADNNLCYYAEFLYHDVGFRIIADNLTENEFVGVLTSLL